MKTRQLKVYKQGLNPETLNSSQPEIKLRGQWLEKAGFKPGDSITVFVRQNEITIKRREE